MTACPAEDRLPLRLDGDLSRNDEAALDAHLRDCARCRERLGSYERLVGLLRDEPRIDDRWAGDLAERVLASAALSPPARPQPRRPWAAPLAVAAALAAAAGVAITLRAPSHEEFRARGAATAPESWAGLRVYVRRIEPQASRASDAPPAPLGARMRRDDALLFAYDNAGPEPYAYLAVYAVDAAGGVHWYHPAWTDAAADPASIRIERGAARELREEIRQDLPPGPMRIHALFTSAPLRARGIDASPERVPPDAAHVIVTVDVD